MFETAIGSEIVCLHVCDDVAFATSEELRLGAVEDTTIGHTSEVAEPPLRVGNVKYKNLMGVWEDAMRAEFKGHVGLNACEFVDVVPDGVKNSQVFGVRFEYLDRSKSEGSSGSLRS